MGEQDVTLTEDQQQMLAGVLGNDYCDNICSQVISEHSDRLVLERVTCPDKNVQAVLDHYWKKLKLRDLQSRTHRATIRDGNFCLMVEYDFARNKIAIHREKWWDGDTGVFIGYDMYGNMLYAVKEWQTPEGRRRTIYYDGAVERFISTGAGAAWLPILLPSDVGNDVIGGTQTSGDYAAGIQPNGTEPIAIPRQDEDGNDLSIPFIHFQNPGDMFDEYGQSILDGGLIGAQDQINDLQYDISAMARMTGYPRTWSKGYKLEKKRNRTIAPKTGPGVHYHAEENEAAWGQIPAGDPGGLLSVYKQKVESFCRSTSTPYASITGNWPSGEAIYKLEQPIRGKTVARQNRMAAAWEEVFHRCIELINAFDPTLDLDEDAELTAEYKDAGDRDPLALALADQTFWQAAEFAVSAGMPIQTYLRFALKQQGVSEDAIEEVITDLEAEVEKQRANMIEDMKAANVPSPTPRTGSRAGRSGAKTQYQSSGQSGSTQVA